MSERAKTRDKQILQNTEAELTADTTVYDQSFEAWPQDGAGYGKHKQFDGVHYYSQLSFVEDGVSSGGITALTGDVTAGPGTGSQAATIAANAVTNTKLDDMPALSVKTRADLTTAGDPGDTVLTRPASNGAPRPVLLCDRASGIIGDVLAEKDIPSAILRTAAALTEITPEYNVALVSGSGSPAADGTYITDGTEGPDGGIVYYKVGGSGLDDSMWISGLLTWQIKSGGNTLYIDESVAVATYPWDVTTWVLEDGVNPLPTVTRATADLQTVLDTKFDLPKANAEQVALRSALGLPLYEYEAVVDAGGTVSYERNTFNGVTFTVSNVTAGRFTITPDAGTPFTAGKIYCDATPMDNAAGYCIAWENTSTSEQRFLFKDDAGVDADPSQVRIHVRIYA